MTDQHLEIGRISKAHGLRGDVVVSLLSDRTERLNSGAVLFADGEELTVVSSRPHQHKFLVLFEGYASRERAETLRGKLLTAPPIDDPDTLWVHDLIDVDVFDIDGTLLGHTEAVQDNPASDLLVLEDGGLIPLTFFVELTEAGIVVDPPDGLLTFMDESDDRVLPAGSETDED